MEESVPASEAWDTYLFNNLFSTGHYLAAGMMSEPGAFYSVMGVDDSISPELLEAPVLNEEANKWGNTHLVRAPYKEVVNVEGPGGDTVEEETMIDEKAFLSKLLNDEEDYVGPVWVGGRRYTFVRREKFPSGEFEIPFVLLKSRDGKGLIICKSSVTCEDETTLTYVCTIHDEKANKSKPAVESLVSFMGQLKNDGY